MLNSVYIPHVSHLSLSVASPILSAACLVFPTPFFYFSHPALPLFINMSLSLSCICRFLSFFPFSKLITERVLMGNPVEKKSILSHTKSRFLLSCHFCCFSFSLSPAATLVSSSTLVFRVSWNTVVDFYEVLFHWYLID